MTDMSLLRIRDDVALASEIVAPTWPLSSVIACNPLAGFEHLPFPEALQRAEALFGSRGLLTLDAYRDAYASGRIDEATLDRAAVDLQADDGNALRRGGEEPAPERTRLTVAERHDQGAGTALFESLRDEIASWCAEWATSADGEDPWHHWRRTHPTLAGALPDDVAAALRASLEALRVPHYAQRTYLEAHVAALPGWVSHLRWRQEHDGGDLVIAFLAASVATEADLVGTQAWYFDDGARPRPPATVLDTRPLVWHEAYERTVHDQLLRSLEGATSGSKTGSDPDAQLVWCIDVRSEPLRRHLEQCGEYETYGYAGFFGLAAHVVPVTGRGGTDQFPVLLGAAAATVREQGSQERARTVAAIDAAWHGAKHELVSPLALAEASGWIAGPVAALRTLAPGLSAAVADRLPHQRSDGGTTFDRNGIAVEDQAAVVQGILDLGIGDDPAPIVVLCGHGSLVDNNPTESGLACGACGGHDGAANARIVAAMANDPEVRQHLAAAGHPLPDGTWFAAAHHDTAADRVEILDPHLVPSTHVDALAHLIHDLHRAGDAAALERAGGLPGRTGSLRSVRRRARNWAEPVAELGLAGNMAFVVAPRAVTQEVDLGRRVFLHSYDATTDADGSRLRGILTAPLVVAQWINAQYYFSTTDPEVFGAGTKAVHNVLGDIGVLSGPGGDLRRGLPLQSVRAGERLLHEPVRLLAVVQGSLGHVDDAIRSSVTLDRLVSNRWIHLVARPDASAPWQRRTRHGWADAGLDQQAPAWPEAG